MGEGWETRRRRDGGHDFAVLRLAFAGQIRQLIVDTAHFKYNASAAIEAWVSTDARLVTDTSSAWQPLLARTRLQPDTRHVLPVAGPPASTALRLDAFPDGGISRLRVIGTIDAAARAAAGLRWLNSLPAGQAAGCLESAGLTADAAAAIAAARPLPERGPDGWPGVDAAGAAALAALVDGPGAG
jgi:allantoicase